MESQLLRRRPFLVEISDRKVTPWGPPKKRSNLNKPEMYRWLERVCPKI